MAKRQIRDVTPVNPEDFKRRGRGRPPKSEQITLDEIMPIMIAYAKRGKFFMQLPAAIWDEKKVKVSMTHLESIQDDEFLNAKSIAFGYCVDYWTEKMLFGEIPPSAWIFIMKNVGRWRDSHDVKIEQPEALHKKTEEKLKEEALKEKEETIKLLKDMDPEQK